MSITSTQGWITPPRCALDTVRPRPMHQPRDKITELSMNKNGSLSTKNYLLHKLFTVNLTLLLLLLLCSCPFVLIRPAPIASPPLNASLVSTLIRRVDRTSSACLRCNPYRSATAPISFPAPASLVSIRRRADRVSFPAPASPL